MFLFCLAAARLALRIKQSDSTELLKFRTRSIRALRPPSMEREGRLAEPEVLHKINNPSWRNQLDHVLFAPSLSPNGMDRPKGKRDRIAGKRRPLSPEVDAVPRVTRAPARTGSGRSLIENRRRIYRRAFGAGRFARRRPLCSGSPTRTSLRARANFEVRNTPEIEATLRRQNNSRHPLPRGLSHYRGKFSLTESKSRVVTAACNRLLALLAPSTHFPGSAS